ncbi:MAG TPA: hypothetical protein VKT29_16450 [Terriglobales bacterium]|nr:hypothetical protein [Terriglobales bacterium]
MFLLVTLACDETKSPASNPISKPQVEQNLPITLGGFIQNGPEGQLLDGQCRPNLTRDVLQCDIHNGLVPWNITEITLQIIRTGDAENEHHYYRERLSIASLQTETVTIKLGMQLPADTRLSFRGGQTSTMSHWQWLIVGAKGIAIAK